jgi:hypothetical protein
MKTTTTILTLAATSLIATSAFAQDADWSDQEGTFGLGIGRSIADGEGFGFAGTGISARYFITESLAVEGIFGASTSSNKATPEDEEIDPSGDRSSQFDISVLVDYRIASSRQATLNAFGGVGLSMVGTGLINEDEQDAAEDGDLVQGYTDIAFQVGLRGEVWLSNHFSIFGRMGITIDPISDTEAEFGTPADDDVKNGGMDLSIMRGDLLGAFGFTFWF